MLKLLSTHRNKHSSKNQNILDLLTISTEHKKNPILACGPLYTHEEVVVHERAGLPRHHLRPRLPFLPARLQPPATQATRRCDEQMRGKRDSSRGVGTGEKEKNAQLEGGSAEARARAASGAIVGPRQKESAEHKEEQQRGARQQQRRYDRRQRPPAALPAAAQQRPPTPPRRTAHHARRRVTPARSSLSLCLLFSRRQVVLAVSPPVFD
jgi:hypothetical protein